VWNLAAQLVPLAIAILCVPLIIDKGGVDRFGVFALGWALIGYAGMLDFGLGRALTQVVAERVVTDQRGVRPAIVTGLGMLTGVGLIGAAVVYPLSGWLAGSVLNMPADLQLEATQGFRLIALALPIVTLGIGLRGVLEAHQQFRSIAFINVVTATVTLTGPLLALQYTQSAAAMVLAIVASRLIGMLAYAVLVVPKLRDQGGAGLSWQSGRVLLRFGSWMTVSNVISPFMEYMDRFIIGAMLTVQAVAYYATPFDIVSRLGNLSAALAGVLFPALTTTLRADNARASALYLTGFRHLVLLLSLPVLILVVFAGDGLRLWLGAEFAEHSEPVVQWLAVGFFINALARMPHALLHAAGRPDITAKLHLLELPIYLVLVFALVAAWGIAGAAAAWCLRVLLDTALLIHFAGRLVTIPRTRFFATLGFAGGVIGLAVAGSGFDDVATKIAYSGVAAALIGALGARFLLERGEVRRLLGHFRA
jgi:O-antigen/teichoic acid export membrane protein